MATKAAKSLVHIKVIRHIPQGLSVELDNGQRGMIRSREISWDEKHISDWKNIYPIGWQGLAFPIPSPKGDMHEFSLRLVESDPWDELEAGFEKGQIYEGVVASVFEYGAFVEISPGLTGLLHQSQFPSWCKKLSMDLFWPGDKVFVTIRDVDHVQRQIALSLPCLQPLEHENASNTAVRPIIAYAVNNDLEKLLELNAPRKHILIVEDEQPQAAALSGWLRRLNQRVDTVETAEKAVDFLEKTQPDVVLADVGLAAMSGIELAEFILETHPQIQVICVTDWARANDMMDALDDLQVRGAKTLLKPLLPEDLLPYLLPNPTQISNSQDERDRVEERLTLADVPKLDANASIQILLARCRNHLDFEQIILFALDPIHRSVTIVERAGDGLLNKNALPYLIYSPVRDVAEDHEAVAVNEISERERKRFRYLSELCPSAISCIGVPVQTQTSFDHALFVLDKHARQITNAQILYLEGLALAVGTALEQNNLREKFIMMQRTALIGHLTRAMMHEINNLVGPLLYEADTLKRNLVQFENNPVQSNLNNIYAELQSIEQDIRKVINTTKTFGRIVAKGKPQMIRVDEIILETKNLLKDISDRAHVQVQFEPPDELIIVQSHAVVLEQVFLNVVLNAIQQIAEIRPDNGGWVKLQLNRVAVAGKGSMCRILIEDNGPGIHVGLWKKIFEAGFTTRPEGSGIGLYISHNLMEDIGGSIQVSKSHILSGSVFSLEFPIHL